MLILLSLCLLITLNYAVSDCSGCGFDIDSTIKQMKTMPRSSSINSKKFVLVTMQNNWHRAGNICKYNGMRFAMINSLEEQNVVATLIDKSGVNGGFWISGNNLDCPKDWYWLSNGKPIKYFNWKAGEPNNMANTNERCINLVEKADNYMWNDAPCDYSAYYFICEEDCGCNKKKVDAKVLKEAKK